MSDDKRKSPFVDATPDDEDEWDKALDAWDAADPAQKPRPPAPPGAGAAKAPLYHPPTQNPAPEFLTPVPPRREEERDAFELPSDDDEPTTIARVPAELLAGTTGVSQGSGLGHVLRRDAPEAPASPLPSGALIGSLFAVPDVSLPRPSEDMSVVTSAPRLSGGAVPRVSEQERRKGEDFYLEVPEGGLFDPFAPLRDERSDTVRPGAPSDQGNTVVPGASDDTPEATADASAVLKLPAPKGWSEPALEEAAPPPPTPPEEPVDLGGQAELLASEPPTATATATASSEPTIASAEVAPSEPALASAEVAPPDPLESVSVQPQPAADENWLESSEQRDAWIERASWLEAEARAATDRGVRCRGLLIASELHALAGDRGRAHELAVETRDLAPTQPLPHRQARALPLHERDYDRLVQLLDAESRAATLPAVRAHDALFAAAIARVAGTDRDLVQKRLDQAIRALPSDPRAYVNRLSAAIAESAALPKIRWPEDGALTKLAAATATLQRWRGSGERPQPTDRHPADVLLAARAALDTRDPAAIVQAIEELGTVTGLVSPAAWLGAAFALVRSGETETAARLEKLDEGASSSTARRALAAHALEKGEKERVRSILERASEEIFDAGERAFLGVLAAAPPELMRGWLNALEGDPNGSVLDVPFRAAVGEAVQKQSSVAPPVRLAHLLAARAGGEELGRALAEADAGGPPSALHNVLRAELDVAAGRLAELAQSLAASGAGASRGAERDHALVAGLLLELAEDDRAREQYEAARRADPSCEAALRAEMALTPAEDHAELLAAYPASLEDPSAAALALLEAAHLIERQNGSAETYTQLLRQAQDRAPSLPFAAWLAEQKARAQGEFETIVEWLRERQKATEDPVERAYDLAREALLIADRDMDAAKDLLDRASRARVRDLALRELYEKLSPEPLPDRATFWAERALSAEGAERARLALVSALEFERMGQFDEAARLAQVSLEAEESKLARLAVERNESMGSLAANLAERLIQVAKGDGDPRARLEAYERLAELDEIGRADAASAMLWHQSILEEHPGFLPSLRRLEHWLIEEGRDTELEPIASGIAKAVLGPEGVAHAELASRLRTRSGPWQAALELVKIAYGQKNPPLWALRDMEAHAALANDSTSELEVARSLAARTRRPLESATLALRAAEAAVRGGDVPAAKELLAEASKAYPHHIVVQRTLAELADASSDFGPAAEAWEAVAELSKVAAHKLEAAYRAGVLFFEHLEAPARGRTALEAAAALDITYQDVFARLKDIYVGAGDREALASLLESRLAAVRDPNEKVELEIVRGRTLAEIGDVQMARRSLGFALEANPDHPEALKAFADLSAVEGDWAGAEQALIRLVRLVPDGAEQAALYLRLGEVYDKHQPNPERAELAYREVLRRLPGDEKAQERLVEIYSRTGDAAQAIETAQALLAAAPTPEVKRKRIAELARVHELVARDPKKAEALLEAARKEAPGDVELLAGLAGFYKRAGKMPAVTLLLDRAASDARRALSTGRFEVGLFSTLAAVARLRERNEAARIAEATLAAVEGRPSELPPAGTRAADPAFDELIAPDLLTPAFRTLLAKAGEVLDAGAPVDLKGLRVMPLPLASSGPSAETRDLARTLGLADVEVFVSPALGAVCLPASAYPPQIVMGQPLLNGSEDAVRRFLVTRALKIISVKACALSRSAPIDLLPLVYAFLHLFAPDWQPTQVDATRLRDMETRLARAKPARVDPDVGTLALEVIGALGNRTSTLHTVVNGWGNRLALLACGDLSIALSSIARAAGHSTGPAASGTERVTWIGRNAEARDLVVFTVSDAYAEVRAKLGV